MCDADTLELVFFQSIDAPIGGDVDVTGFHGASGKIGMVLEKVKLSVHLGGHQVSRDQKIADFESLPAVLVEDDLLLEKTGASFAGDRRHLRVGKHGGIFDHHFGIVEFHDLLVALVIEVIDVLEKFLFIHLTFPSAAANSPILRCGP